MNLKVMASRAARQILGKTLMIGTTAFLANMLAVQTVNGENTSSARRYINGIYAPLPDQQRLDALYEAARRDSKYVDAIKQSREGFSGMNVEAALETMTEDAQLIDITDDGPSIKVSGRDQMRASMGKSFTGQASSPAGTWIPEKSGGETWGIYKNIKVTYHYSTFVRADGTEWTRPMIVVAEHKDGKRWREWRFKPEDR